MRRNTPVKQRGMFCPCGRSEILALGLCSSCYSMKRQDEENYGGLREAVLDRDQRRCRACPNIERHKLCVHSPRARRFKTRFDDYPLHWLSRNCGANADSIGGDDAAATRFVARKTSRGQGAALLAFGFGIARRYRAIVDSGLD